MEVPAMSTTDGILQVLLSIPMESPRNPYWISMESILMQQTAQELRIALFTCVVKNNVAGVAGGHSCWVAYVVEILWQRQDGTDAIWGKFTLG